MWQGLSPQTILLTRTLQGAEVRAYGPYPTLAVVTSHSASYLSHVWLPPRASAGLEECASPRAGTLLGKMTWLGMDGTGTYNPSVTSLALAHAGSVLGSVKANLGQAQKRVFAETGATARPSEPRMC